MYLFHYLGEQEEMVLDTLVRRCLSFCSPLDYPIGCSKLCKGFFNLNFGLHPLEWTPNFCCFAVLFVLCFLSPTSDGPQPAFDGLQPKSEDLQL